MFLTAISGNPSRIPALGEFITVMFLKWILLHAGVVDVKMLVGIEAGFVGTLG